MPSNVCATNSCTTAGSLVRMEFVRLSARFSKSPGAMVHFALLSVKYSQASSLPRLLWSLRCVSRPVWYKRKACFGSSCWQIEGDGGGAATSTACEEAPSDLRTSVSCFFNSVGLPMGTAPGALVGPPLAEPLPSSFGTGGVWKGLTVRQSLHAFQPPSWGFRHTANFLPSGACLKFSGCELMNLMRTLGVVCCGSARSKSPMSNAVSFSNRRQRAASV
mmetsp:Transcript_103869/g.298456  ORF Transcript_103869/g.298456 Transcript_103869/m.298456 type:complete len:219 (-) Transcript_103869:360-1016(-)